MRRRVAGQRFALPAGEIRTRLEDRVARRQRIARLERRQEIGGEPAAAAAQLDDLAALRHREDGRDLRRRAPRANNGVISGAVTKSPAAPSFVAPAA